MITQRVLERSNWSQSIDHLSIYLCLFLRFSDCGLLLKYLARLVIINDSLNLHEVFFASSFNLIHLFC